MALDRAVYRFPQQAKRQDSTMGKMIRIWFRHRVRPLHYLPALGVVLCLLGDDLSAREVAGWVERVRLLPSGIELKAKLDTGAKTSSINAQEMEFFVQEGAEHVRFKVRNKAGEAVVLSLPVIKRTAIKRHFRKARKRPVVPLTICVGSVRKEVEVNLVDRTNFNYPLLLGRTYLAGEFLIDPQASFIQEPQCAPEADQ